MKTFSLSELNAYLHRVIALNFEEPLWVRAEVAQANMRRGHTYIELVQKEGDKTMVSAKASAVLWARRRKTINEALPDDIEAFLQPGSEVSLLVEVTFHAVFGLKLLVLNMDPSYTLGKLEIERRKAIA